MGRKSLPKLTVADSACGHSLLHVPKNRYTSMLNDKRCKRRKAGDNLRKQNQKRWGCKAGRRPRMVQCSGNSNAVIPKRTGRSTLERTHARTERRVDISLAVDQMERYDPLQPFRTFHRDGFCNNTSGYFPSVSGRRWSGGGSSYDWEPHHHILGSNTMWEVRSPRDGFHHHPFAATVDMDEVLECGLTRRQVEELQTRDITPSDFELLLELDEKVAKKTLGKEGLDAVARRVVFAEGDEPADCGVCLGALEVDDLVARLPCDHSFHDECISRWLTDFGTTCPFKCKIEVLVAGEAEADEKHSATVEVEEHETEKLVVPGLDVEQSQQSSSKEDTEVEQVEQSRPSVADDVWPTVATAAVLKATVRAPDHGASLRHHQKNQQCQEEEEAGREWAEHPGREESKSQMRHWTLKALGGGKFQYTLTC